MPLLAPVMSAVLDGASCMSADRSTNSAKGGSPSGTKLEESSYGCTDAFAIPHPLACRGSLCARFADQLARSGGIRRRIPTSWRGKGDGGHRRLAHAGSQPFVGT